MKSIYFTAVLTLLATNAFAQNTAQQWATVLNLSGRQRMLTQKMSKEALFANAGIKTAEMQKSMSATAKLFETTLAGLRDGDASVGLPATTDKAIIAQLDKVKGMFAELQPIIDAAGGGARLDESQLAMLAEKNVPLLVEMNKAVKMYETAAKSVLGGDEKSAVVINLAGRQRMLTQKMTKEALLVALGVDAETNKKNVMATAALFDTTLTGLLQGNTEMGLPGTSDAGIVAQLGKVKTLWTDIKPALESVSSGTELTEAQWTELTVTNVTLLKEMNAAVQLFAAAAK